MIGWSSALTLFGEWIAAFWRIDGISEFAAALIGGGFALTAQQMAITSDRKRSEVRLKDEAKARAWAIFFKINEVFETLNGGAKEIAAAKTRAQAEQLDLWQTLQFPPHDSRELNWETEELVLLIDHGQLELMAEYQRATVWMANYIQSAQLYREMRLEFLMSMPSKIEGQSGVMELTDKELAAAMPKIAHLRTLADSLDEVITAQANDMRKVLKKYSVTMKEMIGTAPELEFRDEKSRAEDTTTES